MRITEAIEKGLRAGWWCIRLEKIKPLERLMLLHPGNPGVKAVQCVPVKIIFDCELWTVDLLAPGMTVVPEVKVR